jgi:hypothetical protein
MTADAPEILGSRADSRILGVVTIAADGHHPCLVPGEKTGTVVPGGGFRRARVL